MTLIPEPRKLAFPSRFSYGGHDYRRTNKTSLPDRAKFQSIKSNTSVLVKHKKKGKKVIPDRPPRKSKRLAEKK
jgi:hypothetical protein